MNATKMILTAGATVAMLGVSLTSSAFANYDGGNQNWDHNNNWSYNKYSSNDNNQYQNDWGKYDSWFSSRGYQWDKDRNMNNDWNNYADWSKNNNQWNNNNENWQKNDFNNWYMSHMNKMRYSSNDWSNNNWNQQDNCDRS